MPRRSHLRSLLEALEPADQREHVHRARVLQLLDETAEPFSRNQYAPGHITASAFVLDPAREQLLLIFHAKFARWLQPGGHVEAGDDGALSAARREVREETGLGALQLAQAGVFDVDVHAIPARADQPAHEHFDVRFLFSSDDVRAIAGSDARAVRWVPITELLGSERDGRYPSDDSVLRAVRKLTGGSW
jgi:8-oxo-dGTP pyrophosphatase MutT (NUDIX family)